MTLADLCTLVAGRVPLVIEVKSHFDGDRRLVTRMAEVLSSYDGPAAGMSFDPDQVLALRELIPARPRGIVAEQHYTAEDWPAASPAQRHDMTHLRHFFRTQPDFVAFWVNELPAADAVDRPQHPWPSAARPGRCGRRSSAHAPRITPTR